MNNRLLFMYFGIYTFIIIPLTPKILNYNSFLLRKNPKDSEKKIRRISGGSNI